MNERRSKLSLWNVYTDAVLPVAILACGGYSAFAYSYEYCWKKIAIARQDTATAAGLITVFCVLCVLILISWLEILVVGPGSVDKKQVEEIPEVFQCDPEGFRRWCSVCGHVKPDRTHHSSHAKRCVPKMDHYCAWLRSVIGQDNFKHFIQFVFYSMVLSLFTVATTLIYSHSRDSISAFIAVYLGICGLWLSILIPFFGVHLRYIHLGMTTIEWLEIRRGDMYIFNVPQDDNENSTRLVIRMQHDDYKKFGMPYDQGWWTNWKNTMGPNVLYWLLPLPVVGWNKKQDSGQFNPRLLAEFHNRFRSGKDGYFAHPNSHPLTRPPAPGPDEGNPNEQAEVEEPSKEMAGDESS